ncbi:MAG: SDR family oxidoreductase [Oscillochloris sp.]|nr:SDR family oxidoreductase [Oscillochloris sp.]
MADLDGLVAVVTGGGRGIGRAITLALADAGAKVAITGRQVSALEQTCAEISARGGQALALPGDVGDPVAVRAAFAAVRAQLGPVSILVNNAGVTASSRLIETPDDLWAQIFRINVDGAFYCVKAAAPDMIARRWGRIIAIASVAGLRGMPFSAAYSASKHALIGLSRSLADELSRYGITSNAICPGWTETDMLSDSIAHLASISGRTVEEARAALLAAGDQTTPVTPEDVAALVLRLASPASQENGQAIVIA